MSPNFARSWSGSRRWSGASAPNPLRPLAAGGLHAFKRKAPALPGLSRCARQESNQRPFAPEANALSPELRAPEGTSVTAVELTARAVTLRLAETFTISRELAGRGRGRRGRDPARRRRPGSARRRRSSATTSRPRRRSRGSRRRSRSATTRWRSTRSTTALPPGEQAARGGARRRAARPAGEARSACPSTGCSGCGATGRRRRGRSGSAIPTTWRGARSAAAGRGFRRLKLKLGGRDGLDLERVARGARRSTDAAAPGRRERVLVARRGARAAAADGARVLRAAAAGRRSRTGPS